MSNLANFFLNLKKRFEDVAELLDAAGYSQLGEELINLGSQFNDLIGLGDDLGAANLSDDLNADIRAVVNSVASFTAGELLAVGVAGPLLASYGIGAFGIAVGGVLIGAAVGFPIKWLSDAGITVVGGYLDYSNVAGRVTFLGTIQSDTIIIGSNTGPATIDGWISFDTISYEQSTGVNVSFDLDGTTILVGRNGASDILISVEVIYGSNKTDYFSFGDARSFISMSFLGGAGKDYFSLGGRGGGNIFGGNDIDTVSFENFDGNYDVDLSLNFAQLGQISSGTPVFNIYEVENVIGTAGRNLIIGDGKANRLDGVTGKDRLEGGAGFDTYIVDGDDTIRDSDGRGEVRFGSILLTGAKQNDDGVYVGAKGEIYSYNEEDKTLQVTTTDGKSITIEGWKPDQLGIKLSEISPPGGGIADRLADPIVLDLDGDGLELTQGRSTAVYFDIDGDGLRELTNWVMPDDGLLVFDANANGMVDNAFELFGYGTSNSIGIRTAPTRSQM